jgi:hypothetical protein
MDIIETERRRFLSLLEIVRREGDLLLKTDARLFKVNLDAAWVERLEDEEDLAERLDALCHVLGACRIPWGTINTFSASVNGGKTRQRAGQSQ